MVRAIRGRILGWTAVVLLPAICAYGQPTPAAFFEAHLRRIQGRSDTYLKIPANIPQIASTIGRFLGKARPTDAADLEHWAAPNSGPEIPDLPLVWNATARRFVVREDGLRTASDAVVYFTWIFLRVYDALDKPLRESGSALAIGMASLVTAEAVYRTNWAYLPLGLHDATAMANFLLLGDSLLAELSLKGEGGERGRLIVQALSNVCPAASQAVPDIARRLQDEALFAAVATDRPAQLQQWRRSCGQEIPGERLADIHNLTIRALALERPPASSSDPAKCSGDSWSCHLQRLLDEIEDEQKPEEEYRNSKGLAPDIRVAVTKADPTILIPLLVATSPFAFAPRLKRARELMGELTGTSALDSEVARGLKELILEALKSHDTTRRILSLAGSPPEFTVFRRSEDKVAIILAWRNMARIEPLRGELRTEQVYLELVDTVVGRKTAEAPGRAEGGGKKRPGPVEEEPALPVPSGKPGGESRSGEGGEGDGFGGKGLGLEGLGPRPGGNPGNVTPPLTNPADRSPDPARIEPPGTDPIHISPAARAELSARTKELRRLFEAERTRLELPRESRLLAHLDWGDWRQGSGPGQWLPASLDEFLRMRQVFLEAEGGPYASRLCGILRRELHLAAWLWETRATATADLLLHDLVELAVYAGTEPGSAPERLWKLDLPLALAFPSLVHGEPIPDAGALLRLGRPAGEAIVNWATGRLKTPMIGEEVSLNDLYVGWTDGVFDRQPYLEKLSPFDGPNGAPQWTQCPSGRLCRWFFFGEGLRRAPAGDQEKRP